MKLTKVFKSEDDKKAILNGLNHINELINNGMFQLDEETEQDMLKCGAIDMFVYDMQLCLEDAIKLIESLPTFKITDKKEGSK